MKANQSFLPETATTNSMDKRASYLDVSEEMIDHYQLQQFLYFRPPLVRPAVTDTKAIQKPHQHKEKNQNIRVDIVPITKTSKNDNCKTIKYNTLNR